jgi:hypothetical protein
MTTEPNRAVQLIHEQAMSVAADDAFGMGRSEAREEGGLSRQTLRSKPAHDSGSMAEVGF